MMKSLRALLLGVILFSYAAHAQNDAFIASHQLGGTIPWRVVEPVAKGFLLLGDTEWARTDTAGTILSAKSYSYGSHGFADAKLIPHNGFITLSADSTNSAILLKLDSNGKKVWAKKFTFPNYNIAGLNVSLNKRPQGYWVTGGLSPLNSSTTRGFIIGTDTVGNIDTTLMVNGDSANFEYCDAVGPVVEESDGSYYFTLNGFLFENSNTLLVLKTDSLLNKKWCRELPAATPASEGIIVDGNIIYIASFQNNGFTSNAPSLLQVDTSLHILHSIDLTPSASGEFYSMRITSDSGLILAGWMDDAKRAGNQVPYAVKINTSNDTAWTAAYPSLPTSAGNDAIYSVRQTNTGYIFAGNHLIKTGTNGNTACHDSTIRAVVGTVTGSSSYLNMNFVPLNVIASVPAVVVNSASITTSYVCYNRLTSVNELRANSEEVMVYPNPNNGRFTISLSHPELVSGSQPIVEIYNMLGEKVYAPPFITHNSSFIIDLCSQPAGLYLYRVISETGSLVGEGKLIIQK